VTITLLQELWESFKRGLDPLREEERETFDRLDACIRRLAETPPRFEIAGRKAMLAHIDRENRERERQDSRRAVTVCPVGVYVCPYRDIDCGHRPENWCPSCPNRPKP
jgi:hypothetical protein